MNTEKLADILYSNYCAYVGGKAFNGDPLPDWAAFSADPNKELQANAWRKVADDAIRYTKEFEVRAYREAKLDEFTDQELLLALMTRECGPQRAPINIRFYVPHVIKGVAIDKDHTAAIVMPNEDFEILKQTVADINLINSNRTTN